MATTLQILVKLATLLAILNTLAGCATWRATTEPIPTQFHPHPDGNATTLIVLLPGRHDTMESFVSNGLIADWQQAGIHADFIAVDAHMGYYINRSLPVRLAEDVLEPNVHRYASVGVIAVSLGTLGAILFESDHPGTWDFIYLLGPFVGDNRRFFAQSPPSGNAPAHIRALWQWLETNATAEQTVPVFAGWGGQDRFAPFQNHLKTFLPAENITIVDGAHNWPTWQKIWSIWLTTNTIKHTHETH